MKTRFEFCEERNFSQKINAVFDFLRQNYQYLGKGLLFIALPFLLISSAVLAFATAEMVKNQTSLQAENASNPFAIFTSGAYAETIYMYFVRAIIPILLNQSIVATLVYSYVVFYQKNGNEGAISVETLLAQVKKNFLTVLLSNLGMNAILILATLLFVIPAIYVAVPLIFLVIIRLVENLSFGQAFSRCFELLKNEWWNTVGLLLIMYIIQNVVSFVFQAPAAAYQTTQMLTSLSESRNFEPDLLYTALLTIAVVGDQLVYTLMFLTISVQYFSLVEKREAKGLLSRIDSIGE